jgi:hypothetical protein
MMRHTRSPPTALLKRLRRAEEFPPADQRAVLKLVDAVLETRRRSSPPARLGNARRADITFVMRLKKKPSRLWRGWP